MESVERVMVVDGGGRGQAIAKKLADEGLEVIVSPGNPGNEDFAHSTSVSPTDIAGQLTAAEHYGVDLTIVGPEDVIDRGIAGAWQAAQVLGDLKGQIFAPDPKQAWIESDRGFAKKFAQIRNVPIGRYAEFTSKKEAMREAATVDPVEWPLFVKDNELRQGKGVVECHDLEEAETAMAGLDHFVMEVNVPGPDISHHAFCDGETHLSIPLVVRDHKQLLVDGSYQMTGGMGVIGPLPDYTTEEVLKLGETFAAPVVEGLGFKGMLFSGLKGRKGEEKSLEWNARFGDPEAQVFMRLMKSDLLPVLMACVEGDLASLPKPEWLFGKYATCLVLAAPGYPSNPKQDLSIEGLENAAKVQGVEVLQAATSERQDKLYTAGGRVINIVSLADSIEETAAQAYKAAGCVTFDGQPPSMRSDIGKNAE